MKKRKHKNDKLEMSQLYDFLPELIEGSKKGVYKWSKDMFNFEAFKSVKGSVNFQLCRHNGRGNDFTIKLTARIANTKYGPIEFSSNKNEFESIKVLFEEVSGTMII